MCKEEPEDLGSFAHWGRTGSSSHEHERSQKRRGEYDADNRQLLLNRQLGKSPAEQSGSNQQQKRDQDGRNADGNQTPDDAPAEYPREDEKHRDDYADREGIKFCAYHFSLTYPRFLLVGFLIDPLNLLVGFLTIPK